MSCTTTGVSCTAKDTTLSTTKSDLVQYSNGLTAVAEGRLADAQRSLSPLASRFPPGAANTVAWATAAQAAVNGQADLLIAKVSAAASDLTYVKAIKNTVDELKPIVNNVRATKTAADTCALMKFNLFPPNYNWPSINSEAEVVAAVNKYISDVNEEVLRMGKCKAAVKRIDHVLAS